MWVRLSRIGHFQLYWRFVSLHFRQSKGKPSTASTQNTIRPSRETRSKTTSPSRIYSNGLSYRTKYSLHSFHSSFTQQVSVLNIVKPLSQHTATLKIPNWPVPSVPSIVPSILPMFPIEKRVPLAEKHASNSDVINVSVQQLSFSPYNTRRSAARQSLAKQLSAGFSTSFDAVNEREIILSKGGNPRKRDQSDKENSVRSLPVDKKRNVVWINNIIVGVTWCSSELLGARRSYSVSGSLCRSRVTKGRSLLSVYIDERAPDNSDK